MRKVIGIGETILDIIFRNNRPHTAVPGGSTFNGLISLGRLGVPVSFISEVGNDHVGDIIRDFMKENNISTRYVDRFPDGKSPISLAFLDNDSNADYTFYKDYPKQRLDVPLPEINEDDIFIYGSYYSLNPALRERMVEFLDYARQRKAILYYDPNFRKAHAHEAIHLAPTLLENFEYADIIRGSDEDFLNIFGEPTVKSLHRPYPFLLRPFHHHSRSRRREPLPRRPAPSFRLALHPPGQYDRSRRQLQCWHPLRSVKK